MSQQINNFSVRGSYSSSAFNSKDLPQDLVEKLNLKKGTSGTGPTGGKGVSVLNSVGVPNSSIGRDGDYYIDTLTNNFY